MLFCCLLTFFKFNFFEFFFEEYHQCQQVGFRSGPTFSLGLIRVQTICKGYQQTTLVGRVNGVMKKKAIFPPEKNILTGAMKYSYCLKLEGLRCLRQYDNKIGHKL